MVVLLITNSDKSVVLYHDIVSNKLYQKSHSSLQFQIILNPLYHNESMYCISFMNVLNPSNYKVSLINTSCDDNSVTQFVIQKSDETGFQLCRICCNKKICDKLFVLQLCIESVIIQNSPESIILQESGMSFITKCDISVSFQSVIYQLLYKVAYIL